MKDIIRNVIERRNYELSDMLKKIDTLWVQGSLSDEEREELVSLARGKADVQNSIDVMRKLEELDKRVKALEEAGGNASTEGNNEYVAGKWYYNGNVVTFEGKAYKCIAPEGQVCTWSPSEYPAYWEEYTEDAPLTE